MRRSSADCLELLATCKIVPDEFLNCPYKVISDFLHKGTLTCGNTKKPGARGETALQEGETATEGRRRRATEREHRVTVKQTTAKVTHENLEGETNLTGLSGLGLRRMGTRGLVESGTPMGSSRDQPATLSCSPVMRVTSQPHPTAVLDRGSGRCHGTLGAFEQEEGLEKGHWRHRTDRTDERLDKPRRFSFRCPSAVSRYDTILTVAPTT
jgi:hypothetical protein